VVVRVEADGAYRILVVDSGTEADRVKAVFGPHRAGAA
jgi:anti-sigma regulatory factor (Ser/Thr protein kinase)